MAKNDDRMILIAAALNGILSCGHKNYLDRDQPLKSAEDIAYFAIRLADTTLEMMNERLQRPRSADPSAH
jgi:hypothetical protein